MADTSSGSTSDSELERLIGAAQYLLEGRNCYSTVARYFTYLCTDAASRKPHAKLNEAMKVIHDVAKDNGLEPDCIEALMDYVTGGKGV